MALSGAREAHLRQSRQPSNVREITAGPLPIDRTAVAASNTAKAPTTTAVLRVNAIIGEAPGRKCIIAVAVRRAGASSGAGEASRSRSTTSSGVATKPRLQNHEVGHAGGDKRGRRH